MKCPATICWTVGIVPSHCPSPKAGRTVLAKAEYACGNRLWRRRGGLKHGRAQRMKCCNIRMWRLSHSTSFLVPLNAVTACPYVRICAFHNAHATDPSSQRAPRPDISRLSQAGKQLKGNEPVFATRESLGRMAFGST